MRRIGATAEAIGRSCANYCSTRFPEGHTSAVHPIDEAWFADAAQKAIDANPMTPAGLIDADTVTRLVARLRHLRHRSQNPRAGQPLWYVVTQLLGFGCTAANEWCQAHGLDPNMRTKGVRW